MNVSENWEDLKYFIALAREKKLNRAAKLIGSNHTTVYRRISNFEENYNVLLFERTPGGYYLTPAGEELYDKVLSLEGHMDHIFNSIQGLETQLKGRILITTTPTIATTVLPGILQKFQVKWPQLNIDLKISNQFYDLSKREADIAIRPSSIVPPHLIGRNLGRLGFSLYGDKSFLKRNKILSIKDVDYSRHCFIALDGSLEHLKSKQWLDKKLGDSSSVYRADGLGVLVEFCASGVGLALIPDYMAQGHKNLIKIYKPVEFVGNDLWVLTHKNMSKVPKIKTCTDFLCSQLSKSIHFE